jgi:hypothetical protein
MPGQKRDADGRDKPGHDAAETWPDEKKKVPAAAGYGVGSAIVALA